MSKVQLSPVKFGRSYYRSQYLKSDEWKIIREKTMRKADGKCERCGAPASDAHHLDYRVIGIPGMSDRRFIVAVCRECHDLLHDAIDNKVIPPTHTKQHLKWLTPEMVKIAKKTAREKMEWTQDLTRSVSRISVHRQRLVCGILKMLHPQDFSKWEGMKLTKSDHDKITEICHPWLRVKRECETEKRFRHVKRKIGARNEFMDAVQVRKYRW